MSELRKFSISWPTAAIVAAVCASLACVAIFAPQAVALQLLVGLGSFGALVAGVARELFRKDGGK